MNSVARQPMHPGTERRAESRGKCTHLQNRLVMAAKRTAGNGQRVHTMFAHVAQGHYLSSIPLAQHRPALRYAAATIRIR
jgi:hypothetical protein